MAKPNVNIQVGGPTAFIDALREYKTVVLQPNVVGNRNVLTQDMVSASNTKYVIKWNYDLQGKTITFPQNCLVEFDGGTINNGTIVGNNTMLIYRKPLDEVITATRQGTFIYNTTVADEEDITSENGLLKFKDRPSTDGMGYVILRKDKTFAEQVANKPNTIFEIRYEFDLENNEITIPQNCVLFFNGGKLRNGNLVGTNTAIKASNVRIFDTNINLTGYWAETKVNVTWFGAVNDLSVDSTNAFKAANRNAWSMSNVDGHHQLYGAVREIVIDIPTGNYFIAGSNILGSIKTDDEQFDDNLTTKYVVKGNDSILYWEVSNKEDCFAKIDGTIVCPFFSDMSIYVLNNDIQDFKGIIFKLGKTHGGSGLYRRLNITSGRWESGYGNPFYKVFDISGTASCDLSLVQECNFSYFQYVFYNTNSEAVQWKFDRCNFFSNVTHNESVIYFYFTQLSEYFVLSDCSFSVLGGQTIVKYNSDVDSNGHLIGTSKDNIIIRGARFEGYENIGYDYVNMFVGNAGCIICENINFSASFASRTQLRFLTQDAAKVVLDNCYILKALLTLPKATAKSAGTGSLTDSMGLVVKNCNIVQLQLSCYDFENNVISSFITNYTTTNNCRAGLFENCRINGILCSFDLLPELYSGYYNQRIISFYNITANGYFKGSFLNYFKIPPYSVIQKLELRNKPATSNTINRVRVWFGDKEDNNYIDAQITPDASEKITLFEGTAIIFKENTDKQKIYAAYLTENGEESTNNSGDIYVTYSPLRQGKPVVFTNEAVYINKGRTCAAHKGTTAQRPTNIPGLLDPVRDKGFEYFDTTIEKQLWLNGTDWVDFNGQTPGKHSGELADLPNFLSGIAGANDDGYQFTFTDDATYGDKTVWWNTNAGNGGAWVDANGTVVITNP